MERELKTRQNKIKYPNWKSLVTEKKNTNNKKQITKARKKYVLQMGLSDLVTTRDLHHKNRKWRKMLAHLEIYSRVIYKVYPVLALKKVFTRRH